MSEHQPLVRMKTWFAEAKSTSPLNQKGAFCVTTIDEQGFPDGRFVDLKEITDQGLVFCTDYDSYKGRSIADNNKVAMTFWWDHLEKQVRIKGHAEKVSEADSIAYWKTRTREAHLTTTASNQSKPLQNPEQLTQNLHQITEQFAGVDVPKPEGWGGYLIKPVVIEFLTFQRDRMHKREQFSLHDNEWHFQLLQP